MIGRWINRIRNLHVNVLGINARNLACVYPLNSRRHFPKADNKLLCKRLLGEHGIPCPATYAVYKSYHDLRRLENDIEVLNGFAVKPERGYGGRGIIIVRRDAEGVFRSGGHPVSSEQLRSHIYRILTGCFSLEKVSDSAFIEQLIIADDTFAEISCDGLPDVRIILYHQEPVMAMARVPTVDSGGLANLHQGALGLGIDIQTGATTGAVHKNRHIKRTPDTNRSLVGIQIPHWQTILDMAIRSSHLFGLGYLGVDIVTDCHQGPMIIEVNARPGLNIQLANMMGLRTRIPWEAKS